MIRKEKNLDERKKKDAESAAPQKETQHKEGKLYYVRSQAQSNTSIVFQALTRSQARP